MFLWTFQLLYHLTFFKCLLTQVTLRKYWTEHFIKYTGHIVLIPISMFMNILFLFSTQLLFPLGLNLYYLVHTILPNSQTNTWILWTVVLDSLETGSARTKQCLKERQDIRRHGERNKNNLARLNKGFNSKHAELGSTDTQRWPKYKMAEMW